MAAERDYRCEDGPTEGRECGQDMVRGLWICDLKGLYSPCLHNAGEPTPSPSSPPLYLSPSIRPPRAPLCSPLPLFHFLFLFLALHLSIPLPSLPLPPSPPLGPFSKCRRLWTILVTLMTAAPADRRCACTCLRDWPPRAPARVGGAVT